ncbi:DnaJ-domain-containing protein [Marasmius fiardii PR-910]|nr:DnaJ-domain-containing protein [Marasmius fiardii PR-910]
MPPTPSIKQSQPQNWYKVLGVRNDASKEDIKAAYKKLALIWHPDRHVDDKNLATTKFAEINNAYRAIMLERHIAAVKAREEANNPQPPITSETRPPVFSRPTLGTFGSRRSSSSTTIGSFNSSSRQSSFESVSTPPSTPRFLSRTGSKNIDGGSTTYFDRPITTPIRTFTISPPAQSIDVTLSDLMPTPITPNTPRVGESAMSQIPENTSQVESPQSESTVQSPPASPQTPRATNDCAPKIYEPTKPQAPRKIRRGVTLSNVMPYLASLSVGISRECKYPLLLTLEELFSGKTCHLCIVRRLLNGSKVDVVLDVRVPAGTFPGTKIVFPEAGHERADRSFQDVSFVIQQQEHERFTRVGEDLVMDVHIPWSEKDGEVCYTGIDGIRASVRVDRNNDNKRSNGSFTVFGAGMPKVVGNEAMGRGNLIIR